MTAPLDQWQQNVLNKVTNFGNPSGFWAPNPSAASSLLDKATHGLGAAQFLGPAAFALGGLYNGFNASRNLGQTVIPGHAMADPGYQPPPPQMPDGVGTFDPMGTNGTESTTSQILKQLMALQDPSRYMMDQNALQQQAQTMAGLQFDPVIASLRQQAQAAGDRANRNSQLVGGMFNDLSDKTKAELPQIEQQYQNTKDQSNNNYQQLKDSINAQYDKSNADQEAMYQRLGIQAAAPAVIPLQEQNRNFYINRANTDANTQQSALNQEQQGAVNYTNMGSQADRTEGTQRQADMMFQLQQLLNQYDQQIGTNQAAKSQAYASNLYDLMNTNRQFAMQQAQNQFNNYIAATNLGTSLSNNQLDQLLKEKQIQNMGLTPVKSLQDIGRYSTALGLPQDSAQKLQDVFNSTVVNDPSILSGVDSNTGLSLPPEAKAQRILDAGRQRGLNNQELNALETMALQYFGRA